MSGLARFQAGNVDEAGKLRLNWHDDQRIVVYKITNGERTTFDTWARLAVEIIRAWHPSQRYLALHDISHPGIALQYSSFSRNILLPAVTEEATASIQDVVGDTERFQASIALVVSSQFSGYLTNTMAQLESYRRQFQNLSFKVFADENTALGWLRSHLS
ncbi:MAG: hypothetical protein JNJ61_06620 [Anaerolineae bacterium]|nr:hypothetical protein [Anaerolineae bacterium]